MAHLRSRLKKVGDQPKGNYTLVPNALIYDPALSPRTKVVGIFLYAQGDGFQNVSERAVAQRLGLSNATVGKAYQELIAQGWMQRRAFANQEGVTFVYEYVIHRGHKIGRAKN